MQHVGARYYKARDRSVACSGRNSICRRTKLFVSHWTSKDVVSVLLSKLLLLVKPTASILVLDRSSQAGTIVAVCGRMGKWNAGEITLWVRVALRGMSNFDRLLPLTAGTQPAKD